MTLKQYLSEVNSAIMLLDSVSLDKALVLFKETIMKNKKIIVAGNGGSAAIASHFVIDLSKCTLDGKFVTRPLSLNDNVPVLTATANDLGYDLIFEYQLERIAREDDLLITISSSGNSPNIIKALECAERLNLRTIAFSGFDGGESSKLSEVALVTKTEFKNYGPTEDAHAILCHYIARVLR
jgi:D-sedoheptulose 7-phosphate isomerase